MFSFNTFHVLKACSQLQEAKLGSNIHQLISVRFNNDPYLLASLIHLYSRYKIKLISLSLIKFVL